MVEGLKTYLGEGGERRDVFDSWNVGWLQSENWMQWTGPGITDVKKKTKCRLITEIVQMECDREGDHF